jgi:hypothetical protein
MFSKDILTQVFNNLLDLAIVDSNIPNVSFQSTYEWISTKKQTEVTLILY